MHGMIWSNNVLTTLPKPLSIAGAGGLKQISESLHFLQKEPFSHLKTHTLSLSLPWNLLAIHVHGQLRYVLQDLSV